MTWCAGHRQRPSCKNCENLVVHKKKQAYSQSLATRVVATESGSVSWRRPAPSLIVRFQGKGRKKTEEGIDEDKTKFSAIWSLPQPLHPIMCDLSPSHLCKYTSKVHQVEGTIVPSKLIGWTFWNRQSQNIGSVVDFVAGSFLLQWVEICVFQCLLEDKE